MRRCDNCQLRKAIAIAFDLHWIGADDCPFECEEEEGEP